MTQRCLFRAFLQTRNLFPRLERPFSSLLPRLSSRRDIASDHRLRPRDFPSSGFELVDPSEEIEEETVPGYKAEKFYPVSIGEVFKERYQVVGKLGYGANSTVWLCHDMLKLRYITLKIYAARSNINREISIYKHLSTVKSEHAGRSCLRMLLEDFEVAGPHHHHICLVHQPLGISLNDLMNLLPEKAFNKDLLRPTLRQVLGALDYLHKEAHVIHTDLQPNNILLGVKDASIFKTYEDAEFEEPAPRKVLDDRTIYVSRPLPLSFGVPVLCDLGEARLGDKINNEDIMPDVYRAPEVILKMNWDYKVDIWNVAMVTWDLFEDGHLFRARNPEKQLDDSYHLAEMIAILGPPPLEFLQRSEYSQTFWDENGNWRGLAPIPQQPLESLEKRLDGQEKTQFLEFLRKMLPWLPEKRATAEELIFDPWLMEGLFDSKRKPTRSS